MAWQTPKTDWAPPDGVRDSDFNRIEGNALALYEETARATRIIYVATTGNDDTGNGTSANPYKTITKALSVAPKNLAGLSITIHIATGTYAETVAIKGFTGGVLRLSGNSAKVTIDRINIEACVVSAVSLPLTLTSVVGLILSERASFNTTGDVTTNGTTGVSISGASSVRIAGNHTHTGGGTAVVSSGNSMYCANNIGSTGALQATNGGIIAASASTLSRSATGGGRIHIGSQGSGVAASSVEE